MNGCAKMTKLELFHELMLCYYYVLLRRWSQNCRHSQSYNIPNINYTAMNAVNSNVAVSHCLLAFTPFFLCISLPLPLSSPFPAVSPCLICECHQRHLLSSRSKYLKRFIEISLRTGESSREEQNEKTVKSKSICETAQYQFGALYNRTH